MDKDSLNLRSEKIFPWHFRFMGIMSLVVGVGLILNSPYLAPMLILIGAIVLTAYRGVEFNKASKMYRDYNAFLFIKTGKYKPYDSVDKMYFNASKLKQKLYSQANNSTFVERNEYNGYLKFTMGKKIYLACHKDKQKLKDKLSPLADFFKMEIIDNTQG